MISEAPNLSFFEGLGEVVLPASASSRPPSKADMERPRKSRRVFIQMNLKLSTNPSIKIGYGCSYQG
jgi:hypothetical protein